MLKKSLMAMAALSVMALSVSAGNKVVSEEELGLRKTTLFDEKVAPPAVEFSKAAPGTAKKIERSYVNAPPLIPHSVEGLLPITAASHQCLGCQMKNKIRLCFQNQFFQSITIPNIDSMIIDNFRKTGHLKMRRLRRRI